MILENDLDCIEIQVPYFIDMNWYQEQKRSFTVLATSRLCPTSKKKKIPASELDLFSTMKQCCSNWEGFITPNMSILEKIFRLFLANGNTPLTLDEIMDRLDQMTNNDEEYNDLSIPRLRDIIANDNYYGLRPVSSS